MPAIVGVHVAVKGDVVSIPRETPLAKNCTLATLPSLSPAVAVTVVAMPTPTVAAFAGAVTLAVGETLAVTLVIGNRAAIPDTIFAPTYTMASVIANQFHEADGATHRAALLEVALVLLLMTFLINVIARLLVWRVTNGQRAVVIE